MDDGEFSTLYAALKNPIFSYARSSLSPEEAGDVVNATFEVVWAKRHAAPCDPEQIRQWCFGIARNKIRQERQRRIRKHHDTRFAADYSSTSAGSATVDIGDAVATASHARQVWDALPVADRELLAVVMSTDGTTSEISAMLGVSYSATTTRISRLRKKLKHLLHADIGREGEVEVR